MLDIQCRECPWGDSRPSSNSELVTCPNCGADHLTYTKHADAIDADPAPAPEPPIAIPDAPTPAPD